MACHGMKKFPRSTHSGSSVMHDESHLTTKSTVQTESEEKTSYVKQLQKPHESKENDIFITCRQHCHSPCGGLESKINDFSVSFVSDNFPKILE